MFNKQTKLDDTIDDLLEDLKSWPSDSPEYARIADQLLKLEEAKAKRHKVTFDPAVLVNAGAHILGVIMITNHEKVGVVTSKAIQFMKSPLK